MADKNVNQVIINGETVLDLTSDTVTSAKLVEGATAHNRSGASITGTLIDTGNYEYVWAKYTYGDVYEETKTRLGSTEPSDARGFYSGTLEITSDGYYKIASGYSPFVKYSLIGDDKSGATKRVYVENTAVLSGDKTYLLFTLAAAPSGKGKLKRLGYISSGSNNTYPDDGEKDGYWYTKVGSENLKLQSKTVRPSRTEQTITPDTDYNGLSSVVVEGSANLDSKNIMYGVKIFDYKGTATMDADAKDYEIMKGKTAYVYGNKITGTYEPPTFTTQKKSVTPSATQQVIVPDSGYDGLSQVTVSGDTNLTPANIRKDISIFGVTGTMETPSGGTDTSDATATADDIAKDKTAYVNGEKITGTLKKPGFSTTKVDYFVASGTYAVPYVRMTTHTTSDGIFRKTDDVILAVAASAYGDASASDVAKGKTFTSKDGAKIEGTYEPPSTEPSLQAKSVTPSAAAQTVKPDSGYDGLSSVAVAGDANLTAANIKKGVSIFDVIGSYEAAASGGNGNNNCEAYPVNATNPTVNFKTASGTIKVYGYAYETSSSGWGGSSTTVLAFDGDGYYKSASWGSPSKTSCTFDVSGGKLTGLPALTGGTLLVVRGI